MKFENIIMHRFFHKKIISTVGIYLFFLIYFLIGLCIFKDYGISTDEPFERSTMYVNLSYILNQFGREPMNVPALETYEDKYYGMVLQMPTIFFEVGDMGLQFIYRCRHIYTFIICFIGYIAFFSLCKKIFNSNILGLLGAIMVGLYPRFFAEQFYNIKDMIFVSVFMISMWATERLVTSKFSYKWIVLFSIICAITTNVRIFGVIFIVFAIMYMWFSYILEKIYKMKIYNLTWRKVLFSSIVMVGIYMMLWVVLLPGTWENPIHNILEMFMDFSNYDWHGKIVFMGEVIGGNQLPWYYIPIWLLISIPVWYIACFFITGGIVVYNIILQIKKKKNILLNLFFEYKFLTWCTLLFMVPWVGIVAIKATMYNAWRHCYFLLPPIVMFILYGIQFIIINGKLRYKIFLFLFIIVGIVFQSEWICTNHPFEMVYFNEIGRKYGADFDRDYWHLSELQAYQYIAENDNSENITIDSSGNQLFMNMLDDEARARIEISEDPTYYIETYRGKVGNECKKEGYEEVYSIIVDHFKVASIFKKIKV